MKEIEEELITHNTGILAKAKGFNGFTLSWWENEVVCYPSDYDFGYARNNNYPERIAQSTQSHLQRWLREVHYIHIEIRFYNVSEKEIYESNLVVMREYTADRLQEPIEVFVGTNYTTYELALEAALLEALKQIKSI